MTRFVGTRTRTLYVDSIGSLCNLNIYFTKYQYPIPNHILYNMLILQRINIHEIVTPYLIIAFFIDISRFDTCTNMRAFYILFILFMNKRISYIYHCACIKYINIYKNTADGIDCR